MKTGMITKKKLAQKKELARKAEEDYCAALREYFYEGCEVYVVSGDRATPAFVIGHGSFSNRRVRIESINSGKKYWIDTCRLKAAHE